MGVVLCVAFIGLEGRFFKQEAHRAKIELGLGYLIGQAQNR